MTCVRTAHNTVRMEMHLGAFGQCICICMCVCVTDLESCKNTRTPEMKNEEEEEEKKQER